MNPPQEIDTATLSSWLEAGKEVSILDIRPMHEREEWFIPQSIHVYDYENINANDSTALPELQ